MANILDQLIKQIATEENSLLDQLRILCDEIYKEEKPNQMYEKWAPTGPNTILCLEVPGKLKSQIGFLTLQREFKEKYVAVYWTMHKSEINSKNPKMSRQQSWEINEEKPKKILTEYAKAYKFIRGE